ncbi:MAG TPA: hypothetical protein VG778_05100, partial [Blastocatellia bacterium]|nr:hypothetical protein [Blastocatellia bacterium]
MEIRRRRSNWLSLSLVAVTWFLSIGTLDALASDRSGALNAAPNAASTPRPPASPPVVERISPAIPEGLALEGAMNESSGGLILTHPLPPPPSPPLVAHAAWFNLFVEEHRVPTLPVPGAAVPQAGSPNYRVSTAPMSAGEKWALFFPKVFISPGTYAGIAWSGLWGEIWDDDENKEDTVENYFADAATRAARSLASKVTHGFLEKFFLPTV